MDDGSTDGTAEIVRAFDAPVRLLQQENRGVSAARNRGARESRGALLAFLDADDRWFPTRLDQQLDRLQTSPRAEAVVCATEIVDERGVVLGEIRPDPDVTAEALLLCRASVVSVSSNLLIRREAFDAVGGFDESLSTSADWALTYRLVDRGTLETLDEPLVSYRLHGHNMSADVERFQRDMLSAYGAVFETGPESTQRLRRRAYANLHRMIAGSYFVEHRHGRFARHAASSVLTHPSTLPYFLAMPLRRLRRRLGGSPAPPSVRRG